MNLMRFLLSSYLLLALKIAHALPQHYYPHQHHSGPDVHTTQFVPMHSTLVMLDQMWQAPVTRIIEKDGVAYVYGVGVNPNL